jgi:hypothetical protein
MKKTEIKVGERYVVKVSGREVSVRIIWEHHNGGWMARSESTGREVRIRSAARCRRPASGVVLDQRIALVRRTDDGLWYAGRESGPVSPILWERAAGLGRALPKYLADRVVRNLAHTYNIVATAEVL